MSNPTVCAIMLVNGRPGMVKRAIRSFREQTYQRKMLVIYDTTPGDMTFDIKYPEARIVDEWPTDERSMVRTIGYLRNGANGHVEEDIICHWDSDDWSHPRRIEEQVALLQASGKECVGYRDMLFWDERVCQGRASDGSSVGPPTKAGAAWLYSNNDSRYCLGTSLCYWRRVWEARPFPDEPKHRGGTGEDTLWLQEVDSFGIASCSPRPNIGYGMAPRMIAAIHEDNTQRYDVTVGQSTSWRRAPEWDKHCAEVMKL